MTRGRRGRIPGPVEPISVVLPYVVTNVHAVVPDSRSALSVGTDVRPSLGGPPGDPRGASTCGVLTVSPD